MDQAKMNLLVSEFIPIDINHHHNSLVHTASCFPRGGGGYSGVQRGANETKCLEPPPKKTNIPEYSPCPPAGSLIYLSIPHPPWDQATSFNP